MEKQIDKLEGLLDKENFQSSTEDISVDDQIPYVFCNILMALSERLGEIETKLGITD
jgi:hypothetical protein